MTLPCRLLLAALFLSLLWLVVEIAPLLSLESLQTSLARLQALKETYPLGAALAYVLIFIIAVALCLPINPLLMLFAGATFSAVLAIFLALMGRLGGDIMAFLIFRHFLRPVAERRLPERFHGLRARVAEEGVFYLLLMRLLPVVPAAITNAVMGISTLPLSRFLMASGIGVLPWVVMFVLAGRRLPDLHEPTDALNPEFALLIGGCVLATIIAQRYRNRFAPGSSNQRMGG
jgi:uncharacterized membrane protein YdjX (TVP38/TMEM64 family)